MRFRGKIWTLAVLVSILLAIGCTSQSTSATKAAGLSKEELQNLELFNKTADELYRKTTAGDYSAAYAKSQEIGNLLTGMKLQGITTAEGVKALTDTVVEAKRTFAAAKLSPDAALLVSAKLRLAADALTHRNEPMWHQYDKVIQEDLRGLATAAEQKQTEQLAKTFALFEQHYQMIRPSLLISRDPAQAEKGDSFVTFMKNGLQAKQPKFAELASGIKRFSDHIGEWFNRDKSAAARVAEPRDQMLLSLMLGLFIVSVLGYAAWRMFPSKSGLPRIGGPRDGNFR